MYNQAYNRAQLIPMEIRASEINEHTVGMSNDPEIQEAYGRIKKDFDPENSDGYGRYDFRDPRNSDDVKWLMVEEYKTYKQQYVALAYACNYLKKYQVKLAAETFVKSCALEGVTFK